MSRIFILGFVQFNYYCNVLSCNRPFHYFIFGCAVRPLKAVLQMKPCPIRSRRLSRSVCDRVRFGCRYAFLPFAVVNKPRYGSRNVNGFIWNNFILGVAVEPCRHTVICCGKRGRGYFKPYYFLAYFLRRSAYGNRHFGSACRNVRLRLCDKSFRHILKPRCDVGVLCNRLERIARKRYFYVRISHCFATKSLYRNVVHRSGSPWRIAVNKASHI